MAADSLCAICVYVKESDVKLEQFIGYLKFKFKEAPMQLNNLQIFI